MKKWEKDFEDYKSGNLQEDIQELESKLSSLKAERGVGRAEYGKIKREINEIEKQLKEKQNKQSILDKNAPKVENILNFRNNLVNETREVLEKKAEVKKIEEVLKGLNDRISKLDEEMGKAKTPEELARNNDEYVKLAKKMDLLEERYAEYDIAGIDQKLLKNEQLIGKCDLIAANLVKGKGIDEITAKLGDFEFTPSKSFTEKINRIRELNNQEKDREAEGTEGQGKGELPGRKISKTSTKGEDETTRDTNNKLKEITFWDKATNWISNLFKRKEKVEKKLENIEETVKSNSEDFEYAMRHLNGEEQDRGLMEIAEKGEQGFRESIKIAKREKLEAMRQKSAEEYSKKYGGRYNNQDGLKDGQVMDDKEL